MDHYVFIAVGIFVGSLRRVHRQLQRPCCDLDRLHSYEDMRTWFEKRTLQDNSLLILLRPRPCVYVILFCCFTDNETLSNETCFARSQLGSWAHDSLLALLECEYE